MIPARRASGESTHAFRGKTLFARREVEPRARGATPKEPTLRRKHYERATCAHLFPVFSSSPLGRVLLERGRKRPTREINRGALPRRRTIRASRINVASRRFSRSNSRIATARRHRQKRRESRRRRRLARATKKRSRRKRSMGVLLLTETRRPSGDSKKTCAEVITTRVNSLVPRPRPKVVASLEIRDR